MESEELEILNEINKKLNQIITLLKLINKSEIDNLKNEIKKDKINLKILELASNPISYSDLFNKVAIDFKIAEITVKKKISYLKDMGFLSTTRKGKEVYYEISDLI